MTFITITLVALGMVLGGIALGRYRYLKARRARAVRLFRSRF